MTQTNSSSPDHHPRRSPWTPWHMDFIGKYLRCTSISDLMDPEEFATSNLVLKALNRKIPSGSSPIDLKELCRKLHERSHEPEIFDEEEYSQKPSKGIKWSDQQTLIVAECIKDLRPTLKSDTLDDDILASVVLRLNSLPPAKPPGHKFITIQSLFHKLRDMLDGKCWGNLDKTKYLHVGLPMGTEPPVFTDVADPKLRLRSARSQKTKKLSMAESESDDSSSEMVPYAGYKTPVRAAQTPNPSRRRLNLEVEEHEAIITSLREKLAKKEAECIQLKDEKRKSVCDRERLIDQALEHQGNANSSRKALAAAKHEHADKTLKLELELQKTEEKLAKAEQARSDLVAILSSKTAELENVNNRVESHETLIEMYNVIKHVRADAMTRN
ncbi:hypothetical protein EDC01DRAFT_25411 [Geopyxis carbonaria]|nr:hypothetical protein EDC01DRAFT_25411 [Geopyxis carbonaria]